MYLCQKTKCFYYSRTCYSNQFCDEEVFCQCFPLYSIFFNLYYSLTWLSRSWLVTTQIVVVPLYLFVSCYTSWLSENIFSELIQTSQLLPRGGLQPCENYFGFAGRRSWQSFPSNSLSLAALNKVMEVFISSQTWNTDSIYKCQDCSENKVHIDFHKFHSRFFLHQPICKQIMC